MSDVSGIPNMGFGGGNFFAPQFSYNPQMSAGQASAAYMPAENYAQNVTNNLYSSGGGFGRLTDYYSQQVANSYGAINANYPGGQLPAAGTFSDYNAGGEWPSGAPAAGGPRQGLSSVTSGDFGSPEWSFTNASDRPATTAPWDYSGSSFNLPAYNGPAIDWSSFQSPANNYNAFQGGWGNVSNNLNLGAGGTPEWSTLFPSGGSSGTSTIDWSHLFGGGAKADPAPGMAMPGGLSSPMTTPQQSAEPQQQQQPGINWGNVGAAAGAGSTMPYTSGIEPDLTGGRTLTGDATPTTTPQQQTTAPSAPDGTRTYDFKPMFEGGGGGGFGSGGAESQLFGTPASGSLGGNPFSYIQDPSAAKEAPAPSAEDLAAQGRAKLAELMGGTTPEQAAETTKAVEDAKEAAAGEAVPLPRERPAGADAARPPADIPPQDLVPLAGRNMKFELAGVNPRFAKALQEFTREYNGSQDDYSMALRSGKGDRDKGFHATGNAVDVNLIDRSNGERLTDYQTRDPVVFKAYQDNANAFHTFLEKNYPDLAEAHRWGGYFSGDTSVYGAQDIMHHDLGGRYGKGMAGGSWAGGLGQQEADTWGLPYGGGTKTPYPQFTFDWSKAPIPDVGSMPLTYKSPGGGSVYQIDPTTGERYYPPMGGKDKMGELSSRDFTPAAPGAEATVAPEARSGVNQGQDVPRPPADIPDPRVSGGGFNAIDAAAKHSGLELARANIDTPIEKIAMERGGQKAVDQVSSMAVGKTPRELMQSYGGLFMSRAEPLFSSLGITRSDFEKAIGMPQTKQDLKMRFGGDFGSAAGGELPTAGSFSPFPDFRESSNFENRSAEQLPRDQLAALQTEGTSYPAGSEVAPTTLGNALGLGDLPSTDATFNERFSGTAAAPETAHAYPEVDPFTGPNPSTGVPGTSWFSETPYNYGGGLGTDWNPVRDQQQQQAELQTQRAPMMAQINNNGALRDKLMATMVDEMGVGASDWDYAKVAESLFNRGAVTGNYGNIDVPGMLGGTTDINKYYEGQHSGQDNVMGSKYLGKLALVQNDQALRDRLTNVLQQVAAGSDLSRLSTDNASGKLASGRINSPFATGYGVSDFSPGNTGNPGGETFFRSDNPFGDPRGTNQIGLLNQQDTREWYKELRPYTSYPPY